MSFPKNRIEWITSFVPEPFRSSTWDDFDQSDEGRQDIVRQLQQYVDDLVAGSGRSLILYGPPGSGKTEIASIIWRQVAPRVPDRSRLDDATAARTADNIVWGSGAQLPDIAKADRSNTDAHGSPAHHIMTAYFAVVDDVDKCAAGSWSEVLLRLIDSRLWRHRVPTIATMNLTPAAFVAKYGEHGLPIFDRFRRAGALVIRVDPPA